MAESRLVLADIVMGESVRWHDGRLWFCDWGAGEVIRVEGEKPEVVARMDGLPFCIDWLPDGRLLIIDGPGGRLLRHGEPVGEVGSDARDRVGSDVRDQAGSDARDRVGSDVRDQAGSNARDRVGSDLRDRVGDGHGQAGGDGHGQAGGDGRGRVGGNGRGRADRDGDGRGRADGDDVHADLRAIGGPYPWNDIATDSRGNAYVNNIGFQFPGGQPAPGLIAVVTPDGSARVVAGDLHFPNGMAVTGDDSTLIVAESYAHRLTAFDIAPDGGLSNRRVWAQLGDGAAPDGVCVDAAGAVWYADVPNRQCVRLRAGGEVLAVVGFEMGAFDCVVGDGPTLYTVTADYSNPAAMFTGRTGRLYATEVDLGVGG